MIKLKFLLLISIMATGSVMGATQSEFTVPDNSTFIFEQDLISPSVVDESSKNCLQYFESIQNVKIRGLESRQSSIAIYCPEKERSLGDDIASVKAVDKSHIVTLHPYAKGATHRMCFTSVKKNTGAPGWNFYSVGACSGKSNLPDSPSFKDAGVEVSGYPVSVEIKAK